MGLAEYRRKRSFERTREPPGEAGAEAIHRPVFVVQLHHARRRHYDLRLQVGDVLKSWAVPKGPSFDPSVRRMAIEVEDHPLDYARFEGEIPAGEYGAGRVAIFDRGAWITEGDPRSQLARGDLKFELFGEKLRGRWHLVRTKRSDRQPAWLLLKERDAHAGEFESDDLLEGAPREGVRSAERKRRGGWSTRARRLTSARPASGPPGPFTPQLARASSRPPTGERWLHELKWDGYRLLTSVEGGRVRLWTRNHLDWTEEVPEIAEAVSQLGLDSAALDGELISGGGARADFSQLQAVLSGAAQGTLGYVLFDVLELDGVEVSLAPLHERKALLQEVLRGAPPRLSYSAHVDVDGPRAFALAVENGFEGVISKRADGPYRGGRSDAWRKSKRLDSDEYVVVGTTPSKGRAAGLGALLLAAPDSAHGLRYVGRVGSGLTDRTREALERALEGTRSSTPTAYIPEPAPDLRGARWVEPRVVVEVFDRGKSRSGLLRQPSFKSMRPDKSAEELTMKRTTSGGGRAPISSPDKPLFPESGVTKRDLADYYEAAMDYVLPEIVGRPLAIVRCPSGIGEGCFFQKHPTAGMRLVGGVRLREERGAAEVIVVRGADGLMELVQFNAIELHPWGALAETPDLADKLVFDLDPGPGVSFDEVVGAAREVRTYLKRVGLVSFVRTTGGKGLHVVAPLDPPAEWDLAKPFARAFAEGLVGLAPERFVAHATKRARHRKIFVDYLRNGRGATAVASFSVRAREDAPVAMPLRWSELGRVEGGGAFTMSSARRRLARLRSHPWEEARGLEQGLDDVAARLSDQFGSAR